MPTRELLVEILGWAMVFTGIFDAVKYSIQAMKLAKVGTSEGQSRKFMVFAIGNDIVKILYSVAKEDIYIFLSSALAMACMFHLWYFIYKYYPYKYRNLKNFKRPSLWKFTLNACIPNNRREHL